MNHTTSDAPTESPVWLFEPRQVLSLMLDRGLLMLRPNGGLYFLTDERGEAAPVLVSDGAVDVLLERGWLTRVSDPGKADVLYLLTAEGRRGQSAERGNTAEHREFPGRISVLAKSGQDRFE